MALVRRATAALLHSPLHGLLDRSVLLITVTGRRTGRPYTLPVQYAVEDRVLWVLPGHPERKTWWRNLERSAPVDLELRGRVVHAKAQLFRGTTDPAAVEQGLQAYLRRFPALRRRWGEPDAARVAATVLVRVTPDDPSALARPVGAVGERARGRTG